MPSHFSSRLKQLRKDRCLSQEQLGKLLGVTKVSISKYESGQQKPELENVMKLSEIFNISIDYLLGKSDYEQIKSNEIKAITEDANYFYYEGKKEGITKSEAEKLKEHLEMYRLYSKSKKNEKA